MKAKWVVLIGLFAGSLLESCWGKKKKTGRCYRTSR